MSSQEQSDDPAAPSPTVILGVYTVIGSILSFSVGHTPGRLPDSVLAEVCPSIAVICFFLCTYSVYDVMACGVVKAKHRIFLKERSSPKDLPEEVFLAERAQMNQVEQLPVFLVSTMCFSVLVHGKVGALLALVWCILRRLYASRYRNSVGIPIDKKGLSNYTIPCYFLVNAMLMGSVVHALRWTMVTDAQ